MLRTIVRVAWQGYRVPFRGAPFATSRGERAFREGFLVRVEDAAGLRGWGEAAPLDGDGGSPEGVASALPELARAIAGEMPAEAREGLAVSAALAPGAARAAIETAIADLAARQAGVAMSVVLAGWAGIEGATVPAPIPVNAIVGAGEGCAFEDAVTGAVAAGFRTIKIKVGGDPIAAADRIGVARHLAPGAELRADANGCWDEDEARQFFEHVSGSGLVLIEEPLRGGDPAGLARLAKATGVAIAVDESCRSGAALATVIEEGVAAAVVLKPAFSGLLESLAMARAARAAGLTAIVTSAMESGIGVAMAAQVATLVAEPRPAAGLATLALLGDDLIGGALPIVDGEIVLPDGPGLGVEPDMDALERHRHGPAHEVRA